MNAKEWGDLTYIAVSSGLILLGGGFLTVTRWWKTPVGRSLAAFFVSVLLIMIWGVLIITGLIPRDVSWLYPARAWLYGLLAVTIWGMLIGFVRVQFFGRWGTTRRKSRTEVS